MLLPMLPPPPPLFSMEKSEMLVCTIGVLLILV